MEKILITGTGRCGTTFLIKLFSFLEYNTGFTRETYNKFIFKNCNSGMEKQYTDKFYVIKNPLFLENIDNIIKDKSVNIKCVIIPIRDFGICAKSRAKHENKPGGLVKAKDEYSQIAYFNKTMSKYIFYMTKFEIPTIFLDFDKMVHDKEYLYNKFKNIMDEKNIIFEYFANVYDEVSATSIPN